MLTWKQRAAAAETLERRPSSLAVTMRYNVWPVTLDRIRRDVSRLHAHLDRRLFGRRFHLSPVRSSGWYVVEKMDCSPHLHGALYVSPDHAETFSEMMTDGLWNRIAGMRSEYDTQPYSYGWARYAVKSLPDMTHLIFAEDFVPARVDT